jgi:ATP-binding cassette, subfamily C (CFTR/MRP), member 1
MLSSMKGVKMSGLTTRLTGLIQKLRIDEIKSGTKFRDVLVYALTLGFSPQLLAPVLAFGIFVAKGETNGATLDTTRIFTSLSLILLLTTPLSQTLQSIPQLMGALGCIDRIQTFLLSESRTDHRTPAVLDNDHQSPDMLAIYQSKKKPDSASGSDIFASSEKTATSQTSFEDQLDSRCAINIKNSTFGWSTEGEQVLNDINISILRSKMTMIVGPVASGKSTLLKGLLSETLFCEGFVHMSSTSVAFCDQTPWLINATIQENIIGFSDFNAKWYNSVIHACVLESDLATLPKGDKTMVGSKGITLSGGQKQRVAIARAIYARNEIAIFDDVFSGLDANTQQLVFSRVFGVDGLLRSQGTTVVIATHAVNLLPSADYIISLGASGKIMEQGSFEELNRQEGYVSSLALQQLKGDDFDTGQVDTATQKKEQLFPDVQVDEINRGNGDFSVYLYYFRTVGIPAMALFFFLEASYAVLATFPSKFYPLSLI